MSTRTFMLIATVLAALCAAGAGVVTALNGQPVLAFINAVTLGVNVGLFIVWLKRWV